MILSSLTITTITMVLTTGTDGIVLDGMWDLDGTDGEEVSGM